MLQKSRKETKALSNVLAIGGMVALLIVGFAAGYYTGQQPSPEQLTTEDSLWRTQSIKLAGSTTVKPIAVASATAFMNEFSGTTITVSGGGSGTGYGNVIDGVIDIGMASREPSQTEINRMQERGKPMWLHPIALDAVCVVVNPTVANSSYPINLTLELVGEIFAGNIAQWDEIDENLAPEPIVVFTRPDSSGTRGTFEEFCMEPWNYNIVDSALVQEGNPDMVSAVSNTPYSIGYVGFGFLSDQLYAISMAKTGSNEYYAPTTTTLASFAYPMSRYLYFITDSRPEAGSLTDRFIHYILSPEGQTIVEMEGFIPLPEYPPAS
jgi:phosphate transport system substrate-binding protein